MGNTKAIAKRNASIAKSRALLPDEAETVPASLTPNKFCKIKKHLKGATLAVPTPVENVRKSSGRSGAGLSLKSQIMEQIFDI